MALSPAAVPQDPIGRERLASELQVRTGHVDRRSPAPLFDSGNLRIWPGGFLMVPHGAIALRYDRGNGMTCERAKSLSDADAELWSAGFARGLIAWMNGFSVLHASAVARGERALAIAGVSGAGKSTLAAGLGQRGFAVIEDDGLILEPLVPEARGAHGFAALTGRARVKLWENAVSLLGTGGGTPLAHQKGKYAFDLAAAGLAPSYPLRDLLVLRAGPGETPAIAEVRGKEKLTVLSEILFREYLLPYVLGRAGCGAMMLRLAEGLRIWTLARPLAADRFGETLDMVEHWFGERGSGGPGPSD